MGCFFFFLLLLLSLFEWTCLSSILGLLACGVRAPGEEVRFPEDLGLGLRVKERDSIVRRRNKVGVGGVTDPGILYTLKKPRDKDWIWHSITLVNQPLPRHSPG